MTDPTSLFTTLMTSLNHSKDIISLVKTATNSLEDSEHKLKLASVVSELADAICHVSEVKLLLREKDEEILKRDEEISNLRMQLKSEKAMVYKEPFYYIESEECTDGPYCRVCFDSNDKKIRVPSRKGRVRCDVCKCYFLNPTDDDKAPGVKREMLTVQSIRGRSIW